MEPRRQLGSWPCAARGRFRAYSIRLSRVSELDTSKTLLYGLEIQNGASLTLAGFNLTVAANAIISGTLAASNRETVELLGDADFTGGTVTAAYSTLVIGGAGDQAVNLADQPFHRILVQNHGRTAVFRSGFRLLNCDVKPLADHAPLRFVPQHTAWIPCPAWIA